MHLLLMMLQKQGALNIHMLRLGCCLPPLWKFLATRLVRAHRLWKHFC